ARGTLQNTGLQLGTGLAVGFVMRRFAFALLLFFPAMSAQAQDVVTQETYYEEPVALIDFGVQAELAFSGLGDENTTSSGTFFALGGALAAHIGVDLSSFIALLMVDGSFHLQVDGASKRGYAGIGPSV